MDIDFPLGYEPATPQYVLDVMRSLYGDAPIQHDSMPSGILELSTPISDWLDAWLLDDAAFGSWQRNLAKWSNEWWGVDITFDEWRPLLCDARKQTIGDLCKMLASHVQRPVLRPAVVFGRSCEQAGAFLAMRSILNRTGAEGEDIAPSTLLAPYTRRYVQILERHFHRVAPDRLPQPKVVRNVGVRYSVVVVFVSILFVALSIPLTWLAGFFVLPPTFFTGLAVLVGFAGVCAILATLSGVAFNDLPPESVTFGNLRTFRDLARCLVGDDFQRAATVRERGRQGS